MDQTPRTCLPRSSLVQASRPRSILSWGPKPRNPHYHRPGVNMKRAQLPCISSIWIFMLVVVLLSVGLSWTTVPAHAAEPNVHRQTSYRRTNSYTATWLTFAGSSPRNAASRLPPQADTICSSSDRPAAAKRCSHGACRRSSHR